MILLVCINIVAINTIWCVVRVLDGAEDLWQVSCKFNLQLLSSHVVVFAVVSWDIETLVSWWSTLFLYISHRYGCEAVSLCHALTDSQTKITSCWVRWNLMTTSSWMFALCQHFPLVHWQLLRSEPVVTLPHIALHVGVIYTARILSSVCASQLEMVKAAE